MFSSKLAANVQPSLSHAKHPTLPCAELARSIAAADDNDHACVLRCVELESTTSDSQPCPSTIRVQPFDPSAFDVVPIEDYNNVATLNTVSKNIKLPLSRRSCIAETKESDPGPQHR